MTWPVRLCVLMLALAASPLSGAAQDQVYKYVNRQGRTVFTNAEITMQGEELSALELPALGSIDFSHAAASELEAIDQRVVSAHEKLQSSATCGALHELMAGDLVSLFLHRYRDQLIMLGAFALLAFLGRVLVKKPYARRLIIALSLLAASYPAYVAASAAHAELSTLGDGEAACSASLPSGDARKASDVRARLSDMFDLKSRVEAAHRQREHMIEAIMADARR